MPVKMRLHRVGAKHQPSYRIVVTPALTPRDGSYLDQVGFYNPETEPTTIRIDVDKAVDWLRKGVEPTDRVVRLLATHNIDPAAVRRGETPAPVDTTPKPARTRSKAAPVPADDEPVTADASAAVKEVTDKKPSKRTRATEAASEPTESEIEPAAVAEAETEGESEPKARPHKADAEGAEDSAAVDADGGEAQPES